MAVADAAVAAAAQRFGERLHAAYVIGSLAHGGFSALVSDVDVALVLAGPLLSADGAHVDAVAADVRATGLPLAERLSIFWGSATGVRTGDRRDGGRFPPLDRLDLALHGRLRAGADIRPLEQLPDGDDLIRGAAEFALDVLARPDRTAAISDADAAAAAGPRAASKTALFPVRFLYTLRTGRLGTNDEAAAHFLAAAPPPDPGEAILVRAAIGWRTAWDDETAATAARLLAAAPALYRRFAAETELVLRRTGHDQLATALRAWASTL